MFNLCNRSCVCVCLFVCLSVSLISNKPILLKIGVVTGPYKELSCRGDRATCFASLNISLSQSRSLEIIRNDNL